MVSAISTRRLAPGSGSVVCAAMVLMSSVALLPCPAWAGDPAPPASAAQAPPPSAAPASRRYTLAELIKEAEEANHGLRATRHALWAAEARLSEARRALIPQGTVDALVAPAPKIECGVPDDMEGAFSTPPDQRDKAWREQHCIVTPSLSTQRLVGIDGVFLRTEVNLAWPVFTFGKLSAARQAAGAGVAAAQGRIQQARSQLVHDVRRAYYGLKLAREVGQTITDGKTHLTAAITKVKEDLDEGKGSSTVADLRRLQVFEAEVEARHLEVRRGADLALAALRTLVPGITNLEIDDEPLTGPEAPAPSLVTAQSRARLLRPEVRLLSAGVTARRAAIEAERASFYPDVLVVGRLTYAYTSSADTPQNGFLSNPFNGLTGGGGLALRLKWDYGLKAARLERAKAQLRETEALRRLALGGIELEVRKAHAELNEAVRRIEATRRGERAGKAWLTAVAQSYAVGLSETRDFADALGAFFQMRIRWLQALYDARAAEAALTRASGIRE